MNERTNERRDERTDRRTDGIVGGAQPDVLPSYFPRRRHWPPLTAVAAAFHALIEFEKETSVEETQWKSAAGPPYEEPVDHACAWTFGPNLRGDQRVCCYTAAIDFVPEYPWTSHHGTDDTLIINRSIFSLVVLYTF